MPACGLWGQEASGYVVLRVLENSAYRVIFRAILHVGYNPDDSQHYANAHLWWRRVLHGQASSKHLPTVNYSVIGTVIMFKASGLQRIRFAFLIAEKLNWFESRFAEMLCMNFVDQSNLVVCLFCLFVGLEDGKWVCIYLALHATSCLFSYKLLFGKVWYV